MVASQCGHTEVADVLLARGATADNQNKVGQSLSIWSLRMVLSQEFGDISCNKGSMAVHSESAIQAHTVPSHNNNNYSYEYIRQLYSVIPY